MAKLIKITNLIGETLLVNTNAIINVKIVKEKKFFDKGALSIITLSNNNVMYAKESIEDIHQESQLINK